MSTCRFKKNDYIVNSLSEKELYFVIGVKEFDVVLRKENIEDREKFSDDDLLEMEIHEVNRKYSKVDIDTYNLLYTDKDAKEETNRT